MSKKVIMTLKIVANLRILLKVTEEHFSSNSLLTGVFRVNALKILFIHYTIKQTVVL